MRLGFCFAALLLAVPAATPAMAEPVAAPLALLLPADGVTLYGGDVATLHWEATPAMAAGQAEEWEAFLSLDGGRTFSRRITPHLDIALRTVAWQVPNTPTDDARLLIRVGDERVETEIALPARLRIAARSAALSNWQLPLPGVGEAARSGAPGVVAWIEGDRQGRGVRAVESTPASHGLDEGSDPRLAAAAANAPCDRPASAPVLAPPDAVETDLASSPAPLLATPAHLPVRDILGLSQRRNE